MPADASQKIARDLGLTGKREAVKVVVRIRPMSQKEKQAGYHEITVVNTSRGTIKLINPETNDEESAKSFTFDSSFAGECTQREVFEKTAAQIVENVLEGYNGTVFCYGQTGSGKTHTMEGYPDPAELKGLMPQTFKYIFDSIGLNQEGSGRQFLVRASYMEIYNEDVKDLLGKSRQEKLEIHENADGGVYVKDLTTVVVKNIAEIDRVMQSGKRNRATGATNMNATSSRSHSIFMIVVEQSEEVSDGSQHFRVGKLNLVDLAGSERASKTGAEGKRLEEGININQSLTTLGNVITALVDGKSSHIPYRDSKLTRLLQDSLGGNTKTCMIANCGPADYNYEETLSTLRYADRAKRIKNKPAINEDPKDAMLRQFQDEIVRLRQELVKRTGQPMVDENGHVVVTEADVQVIEKVIVKQVGVSEDKVKEIEKKIEEESAHRLKMIQEELTKIEEENQSKKSSVTKEVEAKKRQLLEDQERIVREREEIEAKLAAEAEEHKKKEMELMKERMELNQRSRQQELIAQRLAADEEEKLMLQDKFSSLEEELSVKKRKLLRFQQKIAEAREELVEVQREAVIESEDYMDMINELKKKLELNRLLVEHFIPADVKEELFRRAQFDEASDEYTLPHLELAGNSLRAMAKSGQRGASERGPLPEVLEEAGDLDPTA